MGSLTEREKRILRKLKEGKSVSEIAKNFEVSLASISRSISRIRFKCMEVEDDVRVLREVGFLEIKDGELKFISRDPKALAREK